MKQENTQGSTLSVSPATATAEIVRGSVDITLTVNGTQHMLKNRTVGHFA